MRIYKFGGASVRSAEGIKNLEYILRQESGPIFVVISAMGKTTNAMEIVLDHWVNRQASELVAKWQEVKDYHHSVAVDLTGDEQWASQVLSPVFNQVEKILSGVCPMDYDQTYDSLVSYGEILSTTLIAAYLNRAGLDVCWLDMRQILRTDSNFREATVHLEASQQALTDAICGNSAQVYIGQGFIAGNKHGQPTTLGREGSDYTAAVVGNLLNAESVTIWKDVPGILNADPRLFDDTVLIPELTYSDAVELAYSGAQIIHPKTIKPLENKSIPLYVKPFENPQAAGSVIQAHVTKPIEIPVLIVRKNQVLITIRPLDFSFVLEHSLSKLFSLLDKHRLKVSLIQSSAITISVCVDNVKRLSVALDELANDFKVSYNEGLELLTVRGVTKELETKVTADRDVLIKQRTRRTAKYLMKTV